ncbi:hypothetical protein [Candidatus Finniella inopinata]|uniref:Uncharacterized protein n=1 Tax=Candidatus Finniella inopinata TaxID=1696036 RepID=A0A4Q7DGP2_9PROT|nr:hypothetical protein [Candidatus Finniella inopinata]RZI45368.1 hypothetical protein EQU50_07520 [Candidatus Finniella inopinata]
MFCFRILLACCFVFPSFASTQDQSNTKKSVDVFLRTLKEASFKKDQTSKEKDSSEQPSKHNWTISVAKNFPLKNSVRTDETSKKDRVFYNHSESVGLGYGYEWFGACFNVSGYQYRYPWNPDFSYSFGYYDWGPGGICFEYRNDGGNRFNPKPTEKVSDLDAGGWSLNYHVRIPDGLQKALKFKADNPLGFSIGGSIVKKYFDSESNKNKEFKQKISFSFSYQITPPLSFGIGFGMYLGHCKQPWDSDFTYQLSYNIPVPRGQLNISYANYGPTRYPWNPREGKTLLVPEDGSITLSWSCKINELFKSTKQSSPK